MTMDGESRVTLPLGWLVGTEGNFRPWRPDPPEKGAVDDGRATNLDLLIGWQNYETFDKDYRWPTHQPGAIIFLRPSRLKVLRLFNSLMIILYFHIPGIVYIEDVTYRYMKVR